MSIDSHLIHRCSTQRATTTQDAYKASRKTWALNLQDERCRLVVKTQSRRPDILSQEPVITTYTLLLRPGVDVQIGDRVVNVQFEDRTTDAGPYTIEAVLTRRGRAARHISLQLKRDV